MEDLKQVNKCYLVQVTENQKLKVRNIIYI